MADAVLGSALASVGVAASVLARLGGPLGDATRAAAAALATMPSTRAHTRRASWAAAVRAALPLGARGVHPSWIERALVGLPARARADLSRAGGGDPIGVWLVRCATAGLPPLPPEGRRGPPTSLAEATELPAPALARWLAHVGADQLAFALASAGPEALAGAARIVGERVRVAAQRIVLEPRAGHLGSVRAAIARARMALDARALVLIGARALAPHTAEAPLARRQLVVRLERGLGLAVYAELVAHASAPVGHAPDWIALGAPLR